VHGRQVSHERHVGRVQKVQLRLVVEKAGHSVHQSLPQQRRLGRRIAVRREQSHDAASLDEYVENRLHFLKNRLGTDLDDNQRLRLAQVTNATSNVECTS